MAHRNRIWAYLMQDILEYVWPLMGAGTRGTCRLGHSGPERTEGEVQVAQP